ncbi:hypothetical protein Sjap_005370 [Stephania japonica]|uniref:Uncharacterized protein n=1 Tax=Stephania japonica TaxID=461633 RepID=A0AAP0K3Z1_9MAGN
MTWGIVGDLIMSIMESYSPGASLLVVVSFVSVISCEVVIARLVANYRAWSALPPDAMTKGVPEITTKPLYVGPYLRVSLFAGVAGKSGIRVRIRESGYDLR